ncbi:MFS transporter [Bacillus sp. AFS017336]|uniref:MDR family MFS transporter n=1 Tax=Bacillus sp. AFS017336 TaxID=2033489 RepID=UPI000BEFE86E|nr:MFS transporter [Bacillus sp. AFS017336]PEK99906.1 MFS transporter [Bacillus sp. AFS017336]
MNILKWNFNMKVRLVAEFFFGLFFWMYLPFLAIYFAEELGKVTSGILLMCSQAVGVFANLIGGYLADTYGRKKMMVISAFIQAGGMILLTIANSPILTSPWLTFVGFAIISVTGMLYNPASSAMVADTVEDKDERNLVFAVFYTMININVVIGPIIGGILFFKARFLLFATSSFIFLIVSIMIALLIKESLPDSIKQEKEASISKVFIQQVKNYRIIFTDKVFFLFVAAGILISQTFTQLDLLLAVFIKEKIPVQTLISFGDFTLKTKSETLFSWTIAENGLIVALLTVLITKFANKFNERFLFFASSVCYAFSMLLFGFTLSAYVIFIAMAIFTLGEILVVGNQNSFIAKIAPESQRGQYFAASGLRWSLGRTIAPLTIPLAGIIGYKWTFILIAFLALCGAYLYEIMFKEMKKKSIEIRNDMKVV